MSTSIMLSTLSKDYSKLLLKDNGKMVNATKHNIFNELDFNHFMITTEI